MKRFILICIGVATMLLAPCQAAQVVRIATVVFTNAPADGNKITINGVDRVAKTVVASPSTQFQIGGTTNISAANLWTQLQSFPLTGISAHQSGGTVFLAGQADAALTATMTGTWGTVTVSTLTLTNYTAVWPIESYPAASRMPIANMMINAISTYATNRVSATAPAFLNYYSLNQANLSTGASILSNATQRFVGGYLSNITRSDVGTFYLNSAAYLIGTVKLTNETPYMEFWDSDASADNRRTQIYGDQSAFLVKFLNDAGTSVSNVFEITKDSTYGAAQAIFRTRLKADSIYDTLLTNGLTTNMVMMHAIAAMINNGMFTTLLAVSNTAPVVTLYDSDAASGSRNFQLRANGNMLRLSYADDSGTVPISPSGDIFTVARGAGTDATAQSLSFKTPVDFNSTVNFLSGDIVTANLLRTGNGIIIGTGSGTTLPSGASQALMLAPGAGPAVTPSGYSIAWSSGGEAFYRNGLASEGDTVDNRFHNRTGSTFGAGTDYSLTASTAFIDFGTTDPKVTLPTAGTYLIFADVAWQTGTTANDDYRFKLRNETTSTDLSGSDISTTEYGTTQVETMRHLQATVTAATTSNVIAIWGHNNTGARGTVRSARTRIGYVRLY